jgi:hypothetical protein
VARKHLVIPDVQLKPGVPTEHIKWAAQYAVDKLPDVIVILGDWADMCSLSSYDVGKKSFEGRAYVKDIEVANDGLSMFMSPIEEERSRRVRARRKHWNPRLEVRLGNHEHRIITAINNDRKLEGLIHPADIRFKEFGFNVLPFLQVGVVDGIAYSHYFPSGVMGKPITTARALLTKMHMSCFAGHQQGRDIAYATRADGKKITAIIAGSFYQHDEEYLNPQTNRHWRGIYMGHEVEDGQFDEMPVSLKFLEERYGGKKNAVAGVDGPHGGEAPEEKEEACKDS